MANSRSAQRPATLWPCSRTSTPLQPAASLSSLQTGCRRSNSPAVEASLWPGAESNCRHADFQSAALPTELPGRKSGNFISDNHFRKRERQWFVDAHRSQWDLQWDSLSAEVTL